MWELMVMMPIARLEASSSLSPDQREDISWHLLEASTEVR